MKRNYDAVVCSKSYIYKELTSVHVLCSRKWNFAIYLNSERWTAF